jgi:hypothetical protein
LEIVLYCGFHVLAHANCNYIAHITQIGVFSYVFCWFYTSMLSNHIQIVNWKTYLQILNCISAWPDPNPTVLCNLRGHNRTIRAHLIHVWFVGAEFLNMFICCTWLNVLPLFGSRPMIYCWKLLDRYMQNDENVCCVDELVAFLLSFVCILFFLEWHLVLVCEICS